MIELRIDALPYFHPRAWRAWAYLSSAMCRGAQGRRLTLLPVAMQALPQSHPNLPEDRTLRAPAHIENKTTPTNVPLAWFSPVCN